MRDLQQKLLKWRVQGPECRLQERKYCTKAALYLSCDGTASHQILQSGLQSNSLRRAYEQHSTNKSSGCKRLAARQQATSHRKKALKKNYLHSCFPVRSGSLCSSEVLGWRRLTSTQGEQEATLLGVSLLVVLLHPRCSVGSLLSKFGRFEIRSVACLAGKAGKVSLEPVDGNPGRRPLHAQCDALADVELPQSARCRSQPFSIPARPFSLRLLPA